MKIRNRHFATQGVAVLLVLGSSALLVVGCQPPRAVNQGRPLSADETRGQVLPPMDTPAASPGSVSSPTAYTATVFRVKEGSEGYELERVTIPLTPQEARESPALTALNRMAGMPGSPLPKGTKALSVVISKDRIATVNFNSAIKENFPGGDDREALMINAILATLGQYPNIERVQLLVEGQKVAIGGLQDTTEPLLVPPSRSTQVTERSGGGDSNR